MAKRPTKPRYYKSRKAYYVQVDGKQLLLATGEQDDPKVVKKASEKFRELIPARTPKVVAVGITEEETAELIRQAGTALERVIRIVQGTGCRPAEACNLHAEHLDHEKRAVRIGNRTVTCDEEFFAWLTRLAKADRFVLIPSNHGQPWTTDSLCREFSSLRDKRGMRQDLTLYSFRHRYALQFLKNGGSITDLAAALGIGEKQVMKLYGAATSSRSKLKGHEPFNSGERSGTSPAKVPGSPLGESDCTPLSD